MKNILLPIAPLYYILTEPVDGITMLAAIISIIIFYKVMIKVVNEIRFGRMCMKNIPESHLEFYINKR